MLKVSSRIIHSQQAIPTLSTANRRAQPEGHPGRHGPCGDRHDYQRVCPYPGLGPEGERPEVRGRLLRQRQSRSADGAPSGAAQAQGAEATGSSPVPGAGRAGGTTAKIAGAGKHLGGAFVGSSIRKNLLKSRFSKAAVFLSRWNEDFPACFADIQEHIDGIFKETEKCQSGDSETKSRYKPEKTGL